MDIGILSFRNTKYYPNKRLIEAGKYKGHNVVLINPKRCFSQISNKGMRVFFSAGHMDVVLPRVGAGIDQYTLSLVRHFELGGTRVVNGFDSIKLTRNNFLTLQALAKSGIRVPNTFYVNNVKNLRHAVRLLGGYPVVLKTINSRQGNGVVLAYSKGIAEFVVSSVEGKGVGILVQEFINPSTRRDIRAFLIGDRCIAALELWPKGNEFRSNYHLNAKINPVTLERDLENIAKKAARVLGLDICGVDFLLTKDKGPLVLEVNYSPGFHGLEKATGGDIAGEIIEYLEQSGRSDT